MGSGEAIPARVAVERRLKDLPALVAFAAFMILNYVWGFDVVEHSPITAAMRWVESQGESTSSYLADLPMNMNTDVLMAACFRAVIVAILWLILLIKLTRVTVWFTLVIGSVFGAVAGYALIDLTGSLLVGGPLLLGALLSLGIMWANRAKIDKAAELLKIAVACFLVHPTLIVVNIVSYMLMALAVGQQVVFMLHIFSLQTSGGGGYSKSELGIRRLAFVLGMHWWLGFFKAFRLFITAFTTGVWWFHNGRVPLLSKAGQDVRPPLTMEECKADCGKATANYVESSPVVRGFYAAVRYHVGTIAFAGGIIALCTWLERKARKYRRSCNPVKQIIGCILGCIVHYLKVMTKFSLIGAAFSGKALWGAGRAASQTMGGTFAGAFVHDVVSSRVLYKSALYISFAYSLVILEMESNGAIKQLIPSSTFDAITFGIGMLFLLWLLRKPVFCVLVAVVIMMMDLPGAEDNPATAILLYGGVTHIILRFVAEGVLDISDSLFLCYAAGPAAGSSPIVAAFGAHVGSMVGGSDKLLRQPQVPSRDLEAGGSAQVDLAALTARPAPAAASSTLAGVQSPKSSSAAHLPDSATGGAKVLTPQTMLVWSREANSGQGGWAAVPLVLPPTGSFTMVNPQQLDVPKTAETGMTKQIDDDEPSVVHTDTADEKAGRTPSTPVAEGKLMGGHQTAAAPKPSKQTATSKVVKQNEPAAGRPAVLIVKDKEEEARKEETTTPLAKVAVKDKRQEASQKKKQEPVDDSTGAPAPKASQTAGAASPSVDSSKALETMIAAAMAAGKSPTEIGAMVKAFSMA